MKFLPIILFTFCLLLSSEAVSKTYTLNYNQIPELVKNSNQHVESFRLKNDSTKTKKGHLKRSYYPSLNAEIGKEHFSSPIQNSRYDNYAQVNADLNIYNGGRDSLQEKIVSNEIEMANVESDAGIRYEIKKARALYWEMIYYGKVVDFTKQILGRVQNYKSAANKRIKAGLATESDISEFDFFRTNMEQQLAEATLEHSNAQRNLATLIGFSSNSKISISENLEHTHPDPIMKKVKNLANNPEILTLNQRYNIAKLEAKKSENWWKPSVDIYSSHGLLSYNQFEDTVRENRYRSVSGLKVTFPIFDKWLGNNEKKQKILEAKSLESNKNQTERELKAQLEQMISELNLIDERINKTEKSSKNISSYLDTILDEYNRGVKDSLNVLSATQLYASTQLQKIELKRDYLLARTNLLYLLGE